MPRKKKEVEVSVAPKRKYVRKKDLKPKKTLNLVLKEPDPPVKEESEEEISSEESVEVEEPVSVSNFVKKEKETEEELDDDSVEEIEEVTDEEEEVPTKPEPEVIIKEVIKEVKVEVPVEKIVEKEVIKEVKVEVPVEKIVKVQVPVEKEVIKEIIKEVEVPAKQKDKSTMKLSQFYACMSVINGELTLHYVGPKSKCEKYQQKSDKPHSFLMQCKESIKLV